MIVGCKLLRDDGGSITDDHGRVIYPIGEWIEVDGNGAYVAITAGLTSGGAGPVLAYFECAEPTQALAPEGVICYRRVRRLADPAPERISPKLRGDVACDAPDLTADQRVALARESTPEWRGHVARHAPSLTAEQRVALARESTPDLRGMVACYTPGLTGEQRIALARESDLWWCEQVARFASDLTGEQREALRAMDR
jgi:hypothetical protein